MNQQIQDTRDGLLVRTVDARAVTVHARKGLLADAPACASAKFVRGVGHTPHDVAAFALQRFWPAAKNRQVVITDEQGYVVYPTQPGTYATAFRNATAFYAYLTYANP